ncbi:TM2 domain-containing protein [Lentibacter algarum]|uniref:NINE protein n=1 Tax=Lentibacter algarum TaxID=576131 RepID=UPI001C086431|nr:NINE protein [Lentibacter algarum]MBU2983541.1 TM2 domain-containing protein [Lentibacter algarum]
MNTVEKSPKSYGLAVILCGIFGVVGVHHFYLGNIIHGCVDFGLFVIAILLFVNGQEGLGMLVLLADALHTIIVFYALITEQARDSLGRVVKL